MPLTRRDLLIGAGSAWLAAHLPATAGSRPKAIGGPAFGTYWRALLARDTDDVVVRTAVEAVVAEIDAVLSPFRADSEISRFNASTATDWVSLSPSCAAVVGEGLRIAALTGGAFDPAVGGIVHRFGFGPIVGDETARWFDLAACPDAVRKTVPGATYDPCGIAKGYALDLMHARVADLGVRDLMIELGGEVAARGNHPDGRPWQVGVERPAGAETGFQHVLRVDGAVLATSGDGVNGFDFADRRYSHIVDPVTRRPSESGPGSVSVLAETGMVADALATGLLAMGAEAGPAFASDRNISALFLFQDGNRVREVQTGQFDSHILA